MSKLFLVLAALFVSLTLMATPTSILCGPLTERTAESHVIFDLDRLMGEMQRHFVRTKQAPRSFAELESASTAHDDAERMIDPWGKPYFVQLSFSGTQLRIGTLGGDQKLGGEGINADRSIEFELGSPEFVYRAPGASRSLR